MNFTPVDYDDVEKLKKEVEEIKQQIQELKSKEKE